MPKIPSESRPGKKPSPPAANERFISFRSDMRFIKSGGRMFFVEMTIKVSELKRTNNLIEFPIKRVRGDDEPRGG